MYFLLCVLVGTPGTPLDFKVIHVTAVGITVSWQASYNGGSDQQFILAYTCLQNGRTIQHVPILDDGDEVITVTLSEHVEPGSSYNLTIWARNDVGNSSMMSLNTETKGNKFGLL